MTNLKDINESELLQRISSPADQVIDIERLAEKVYQLMREEIRLERARGDVRRPRS